MTQTNAETKSAEISEISGKQKYTPADSTDKRGNKISEISGKQKDKT